MKHLSLTPVLIIGAMVVAAVRYVGLMANSEGWRITGVVWDWVVALSGVGMALLEGVATWWMWNAWAEAQPSRERNVLAAFMVASGIALLVMVSPYVQASSSGLRVSQVLTPAAMWVWSTANALAPLLVMAGVGLAEKLRGSVQRVQPVVDVQALRDEWQADIARIERSQTLQAVQVNVNPMQETQAVVSQVNSEKQRLLASIQAMQGARLAEAVPTLVEQGFTKTAIAAALGKPAYALTDSRISKTEVLA